MLARRRLLVWLAGALVTCLGCDALGNPPPRGGQTEATIWRGAGVQLVTRTRSWPSELVDRALAEVPEGALAHADPGIAPGAVVTLTEVLVTPVRPLPSRRPLHLETRFAARGGTLVRRWRALPQPVIYGLFVLDAPPDAAVTRVVR